MTHRPTAEQAALIAAIRRALEADPRIAAVWLSGSLGRGAGDIYSDVDILALCEDGTVGEVAAAYAKDVSAIATPVLIKTLFGGRIVNVVTEDWRRFDLVFIAAETLARYNAAELTPLFNRGTREPPRTTRPPHKTAPDTLRDLVEEFLRVLGLSPVTHGRGENVASLSGVELLRRMLIDVLLEGNGVGPAERGAALHLNAFLTSGQRVALEALPPVAPNRESLLAANRALAAMFFPAAKALAAKIGMEWPQALEDATHAHLKKTLDFEF